MTSRRTRVHRPHRHGRDVDSVAAAGETRICSLLGWMDGRIFEESARPVHLRRLGDAMARLHHQADGWTPPPDFVRVDVRHLDDFIAARQVAFDLWFTGMARVNPAFAGRLDVVHRWSMAMLDRVLGPAAVRTSRPASV